MDITAVIPARAGSKRLKNKNILPFGDSNLLVHKIRQLKCVKGIDKIVVSSDSDDMLKMAIDEGVSTHKRELIFSDDISVPFGEVVVNICNAMSSEHIMWTPCTSPLTEAEHYEKSIELYMQNIPEKYDSLVSFEILKLFLWDDCGPINYEFGLKHVISQNLPNIYRPTNGIFIAPRLKMIEWKYFHGNNPYKFILDKKSSIDIDDAFDMECAKAYYNMKGGSV